MNAVHMPTNIFMDLDTANRPIPRNSSEPNMLNSGRIPSGDHCSAWSGICICCLDNSRVTSLSEGVVQVLAH